MEWLSTFFASIVGLMVAVVIFSVAILFFIDIKQHEDAIRRNYPVLGRFRGLFIYLGEFFRSYFFAADRDELPFNRAERDWVDHASSTQKEDTLAFWLNPKSKRARHTNFHQFGLRKAGSRIS